MNKPGQRVLVTLRKMIASGDIPAGERLAEIPLAERLGVSRMPVRTALRDLEQEGLAVKAGARGYIVRTVSSSEIADAIEVRGALEGLAARQLAERGLTAATRNSLHECLSTGDALLCTGQLSEDDAVAYRDMNARFHDLIVAASQNLAVAAALSRNDHLPFASVKALAIDRSNLPAEYRRLFYAHQQHHAIVEALEARQSARVEALMREHASAVIRYAEYSPDNPNIAILR